MLRTLQLNGVVECMNKTITEHVWSMRLHAGLPKQLWAKAVNTMVYLINKKSLSTQMKVYHKKRVVEKCIFISFKSILLFIVCSC